MTVTILVGDKGNVDFDKPVEMSPTELKHFMRMLSRLFDPVEPEEVITFRDWRMGGDRVQYPHSWTDKEYEVMLKCRTLEEAENKLGRSGMAIIVQDGKWRPQFFKWCNLKGKNPFEGDLLGLIRQFMKERADEIITHRKKRQAHRNKENEIKRLKQELQDLDSDEERSRVKWLIQMGQTSEKKAEDYVRQRKKELQKQISELESQTP